jgi:hypothetical protein
MGVAALQWKVDDFGWNCRASGSYWKQMHLPAPGEDWNQLAESAREFERGNARDI